MSDLHLYPDQVAFESCLLEDERAGFRFTVDYPPLPRLWIWVECPEETQQEETDPCCGCVGYGQYCWAIWKRRL